MKKNTKQVGASPGSLVHVGERKADTVTMSLFDYDSDHLEEKSLTRPEEGLACKDKPTVSWININGLHQVNLIEAFGQNFNIHPLVLEDILHTAQRPKLENFDGYLYLVVKMVHYREEEAALEIEQVSIILGHSFILSFQEQEGDVFDVIRQRLRNKESRLRNHGPDYLVYRLLDTIVDNYFVILEKLGDRIEVLEDRLLHEATKEMLAEIYQLKRDMILLRKSIWPLREVISGFQREDTPLIKESTHLFLRDVYDHIVQAIDTIESFRERVSGLMDVYLSSMSNRMNEIMKVLTIMASIFIPLTFIAGIYGMNFDSQAGRWNMPELHWAFGYPLAILLMAVIAVIMILYFKKKNWL